MVFRKTDDVLKRITMPKADLFYFPEGRNRVFFISLGGFGVLQVD